MRWGRLASQDVAGAGAETFGYDSIGRLVGHLSDLGSFTLSYLGQTSQIAQRQLANTTLATAWSYLPNIGDRRLASIDNTGFSSGQYSNYSYTTTPINMITAIAEASDAAAAYPSSGTQTATYNNLNQLTNLSGQMLTFDADGNLTSDGIRNYTWDAENRLLSITYSSQPGKQTAFAYDGLGRRTQISSTPAGGGNAARTSYVWCETRLCQERNSIDAIVREYFAEGEYVPGSPAQSYYYGLDQIGSVRRVFATTSNAPAYSYDPYGNALQTTAPLTDFGYGGMFYNADSGLYLTQHRVYNPVSGRWLSRDPIGEGSDSAGNLYRYVSSNPISLADPIGLCGGSWRDLISLIASNPSLIAEIAGTELLGGGPEDPIADAVVVGEIAAAEAESAVAAAEGGGATDFVVTSNGDVIPVPEGASGPNEVANSAGVQYNNGAGGNGLASNVTAVRIMDPTPQNPTGYVNYGSRQSNGGWQSVNPYTGRSVSPARNHTSFRVSHELEAFLDTVQIYPAI